MNIKRASKYSCIVLVIGKTSTLITLLVLSFFCFTANSQIIFEKGYFVKNDNQTFECLIKNVGWKGNPQSFEYRLTDNSEIRKATVLEVKEFGIQNHLKYIRDSADIDRSGESIGRLSYNKEPQFSNELVFLKVLIEGKGDLFLFEEGSMTHYFYRINDSDIQPLIHKNYRISASRIGENNRFRQQLYLDLKCENISERDFSNLNYSLKDLTLLFRKFNECSKSDLTIYEEKKPKGDLFNLNLRPGVNLSKLSVDNYITYSRDVKFDKETSFRIGLEGEFILPFYKNKWAVIFEPTYQTYQTEKILRQNNILDQRAEVAYNSIEFPIGIRHYFYLNDKSSIFLNALFIWDSAFDSELKYDRLDDLKIKAVSNMAFGGGYRYNNLSLEFRYFTTRNVLIEYLRWNSEYKTTSVIIGYTLF